MHAGEQLGNYRVLSSLGTGGMGEVYRAKDCQLGREVALKLLLTAVRDDPDCAARFEREARALASLSHPNIATLHGLEVDGDQRFLVMELVSGETLESRIARGPLPLDQVLSVARSIADGLAAAHARGIVHRDLKPANVMLGTHGEVKLLDFGISKLLRPTARGDQTTVELDTAGETAAGTVMGTAPYMSPEQASGQDVDVRTDIWSFGCVVYEMLTGVRAFGGASFAATLASILHDEPDWRRLPTSLPPSLRRMLLRTLRKDREQRLHDIADARLELDDAVNPSAVEEATQAASARWPRLLLGAAMLVGLLAGLLLGWVGGLTDGLRSPSPDVAVRHVDVTLPSDLRPTNLDRGLALSPDGRVLVYASARTLLLRRLDEPDVRPLAGGEGGSSPFFSPDGRWIGFWADGQLRKLPLAGGVAIPLCRAQRPSGVSWGDDGHIVFGQGGAGIFEVSADGGEARLLLQPQRSRGELAMHGPQWLGDRRALLYTLLSEGENWNGARIVVQSLDASGPRVLLEQATDARHVGDHLLFLRGHRLMAMRFDDHSYSLHGPMLPLVDGVWRSFLFDSGGGHYALSSHGMLAYFEQPAPYLRSLVWVDRAGNEQALPIPQRFYQHPRLSPDGRRIVVDTIDSQDLWLYELDDSRLTRLTTEQTHLHPVWSADGRRVIFDHSQGKALYWKAVDDPGPSELLLDDAEYMLTPVSVTPDGTALLFERSRDYVDFDFGRLELDGERRVTMLAESPSIREMAPVISPDGLWLAFVSDETGQQEVYVQAFPNAGRRWMVSMGGGAEPTWSPRGDELFYRWNGALMAVKVDSAAGFRAEQPQTLFSAEYGREPLSAHPTYDVSPDGRRFLFVKNVSVSPNPQRIRLLFDWPQTLAQRM
ncbi:MAG TPA: protein kinase [Gammaproteobacteria bacterium]|nr:protein kinase [Gammaproteobacteria bacterium]